MNTTDRKFRILYVDDEEDNLHVFKSSFRRHYHILTVNSAEAGLDLLRDNPVDLVISDQRMPNTSGVEFLLSIPNEMDSLRMIMTGYSDIETVIEALNTGKIQKYIKKPWVKEELKIILDEALMSRVNKGPDPVSPSRESIDSSPAQTQRPDSEPGPSGQTQQNEIDLLRQQVDEAYQNVQLLSEIGQEITSTLDLDTILTRVYENVNQLMDASVFGIGTYNPEAETIDYRLAIEKGKRYQPYSRPMEDKNQLPVWCIENKKEVVINDLNKDIPKYLNQFKETSTALEDGSVSEIPESYIYMPLRIKDRVIGLISVQSFKMHAYTSFHVSALRNIAIFVATAMENSKAFHLIENQKSEIQHKNTELEHKVEKRTQELRLQKDELEETFSKLKLLTEIGQEITSTLNLNTILNTVYENVNRLMDASVFGIGIFSAEANTINYQLAIENGKRYQPYTRSMEDKNQFPVWCIENQKEIFINDVIKEYSRYITHFKENDELGMLEDSSQASEPLSYIYIPLLFGNQPIGVLTVQSFRKFAYNQYHLDILRSLASYITTAIQNANSYGKMTEAFEQLKSTQSKLVESEKMASLGVLTAGVAHEINNPVNFISGGISSLRENYDDLKRLLSIIDEPDESLPPAELWKTLDTLRKEIDLRSLLPEMEVLINTIHNGANRTSEIVKGLRNFSRLDENEMKKADLEEGIDSTLVILNNQLKNRIEIVKNYAKIPLVLCYPGELNQVFMNILSNAADAISGSGTITITTRHTGDSVEISIKDDGPGIPEHIKSHIFEPFFTTKAVGKGTGLGLSISYGIIEKHKGKISLNSTPGLGTEFILTLPKAP